MTIGYNDLPDLCKDKIADYMFRHVHLCCGVPGHYLDAPISEEMYLAGFGNKWAESGHLDMVREAFEKALNKKVRCCSNTRRIQV